MKKRTKNTGAGSHNVPQEDIWGGFAAFLASMIEKYAADLNLDELPVPAKDNQTASTSLDTVPRILKNDDETCNS